MSPYLKLEELQGIKDTDTGTGLLGNNAFRLEIFRSIQRKEAFAVMLFGIDNFKHINDLYSYSFGDMVLKQFANEIRRTLSPEIQLFRSDGDGFALIHKGAKESELATVYKTIQSIAQTPKKIEGLTISFSISAGICSYPEGGTDSDILHRNVRIALSQAKTGTKKSCVHYIPQLSEQARIDMLLLAELKTSVKNNFEGFSLHYQPIMKNNPKTLDGCEALLRWRNPAFPKGVSPYTFIPILEKSGLILDVGKFVLDTALRQCAQWNQWMPTFNMNVNVSARQLDEADFTAFVLETILKYDLDPNGITLELTESEQVDYKSINKSFEFFRKHGIKTAFDDFGTGYASVDIFRLIRADKLKIDRSFIAQITYNVTDQIVLKSIIDMCKSMNISVCVEGIENSEIEHIVSQMDPLLLQGYLYSKPIPADEFEKKYLISSDPLIGKEEIVDAEDLSPARAMTSLEIVDRCHAGIFQTKMNRHFTILACNEGFRQMLGFASHELKEKFNNRGMSLLHPEDAKWVPADLVRQLGEGDSASFEYRLLCADGNYIWVLATGNVVKGPDGAQSLIITIVNIDVRKKASLAREKAYAISEKILENLPVGVGYLMDNSDFTIAYISPSFLKIAGYTKREVSDIFDNKFINLVHEEDRPLVLRDVAEQRKTSAAVHLHFRCICKNSQVLWLDTISKYSVDESDGTAGWSIAITDITEHASDIPLNIIPLSSAHKFQDFASNIFLESTFEYDFSTNFVTFSEDFKRIFGYRHQEKGENIFDFVYIEDRYLIVNAVENIKNGNRQDRIQVRIYNTNNVITWCKITMEPVKLSNGTITSMTGKITNVDEEYREEEYHKMELQKDPLTGLLNKSTLHQKIVETLLESPEKKYSLWILDIDNFQAMNDTVGHFMGDKILDILSRRIQHAFRQKDIIGRSGGDEYTIFFECNDNETALIGKGEQLLALLHEPIMITKDPVLQVTLSIGASCYPKNGKSFSELFSKADNALYRAKNRGKNSFTISQ